MQLPNLDMSTFTFVTWVQREQIGQKQYLCISGNFGGWGVYFSEVNGTSPNNYLWVTGCGTTDASSNVEFTDNAWHFVAVTVDNGSVSFYVDGNPTAGSGQISGYSDSGGGNYYLGDMPSDLQPYIGNSLNGSMAETLIFNSALSQGDLDQIYADGIGGYTGEYNSSDNIMAEYNYEQTPGAPTTLTDIGPNQLDGAINGNAVLQAAATYTTSSLGLGQHNITATYNGDSNYSPITSSPLTETIALASSVALSTSASTVASGQAVTLTATVSGDGTTPRGTGPFLAHGAPRGPDAALSGGVATLTTASIPAGTQSITAVYNGDDNYFAKRLRCLDVGCRGMAERMERPRCHNGQHFQPCHATFHRPGLFPAAGAR